MSLQYVGCQVIENVTKFIFARQKLGSLITKGSERREQRRRALAGNLEQLSEIAKKAQ